MEKQSSSRVLFVELDTEARYPIRALELADVEPAGHKWQDIDADEYYGVKTDLYLVEEEDGFFWTDDIQFKIAAARPNQPPTPIDALTIFGAYLTHLGWGKRKHEGIVFVCDHKRLQPPAA